MRPRLSTWSPVRRSADPARPRSWTPSGWSLGFMSRYVDHIAQMDEVGSRVDLAARLSWRVRTGLEAFLVGQYLLDPQHREYEPKWIAVQGTQVERSLYAGFMWEF